MVVGLGVWVVGPAKRLVVGEVIDKKSGVYGVLLGCWSRRCQDVCLASLSSKQSSGDVF